ncbi:hypothetical protein F4824DRAFT_120149 [Ustulina deusta]|nr:hypothetical protein F4824DRAFT_120149 [Ustulina deusta]
MKGYDPQRVVAQIVIFFFFVSLNTPWTQIAVWGIRENKLAAPFRPRPSFSRKKKKHRILVSTQERPSWHSICQHTVTSCSRIRRAESRLRLSSSPSRDQLAGQTTPTYRSHLVPSRILYIIASMYAQSLRSFPSPRKRTGKHRTQDCSMVFVLHSVRGFSMVLGHRNRRPRIKSYISRECGFFALLILDEKKKKKEGGSPPRIVRRVIGKFFFGTMAPATPITPVGWCAPSHVNRGSTIW